MKKLLTMMSAFSFSIIPSLSIVSCSNDLIYQDEKQDVVEAINLTNKKGEQYNLTTNDIILANSNIAYKANGKNYNFTYDIQVNQNAKSFLNINQYRIIEVKGSFTISNEKISNNKVSTPIYLPGILNTYYTHNGGSYNAMIGNTDDFIISFENDNQNIKNLYSDIFSNDKSTEEIIAYNMSFSALYNPNIILEKTDYQNILNQIKVNYADLEEGYQYFIHVIKDTTNGSFKVVDTNLTSNGLEALPIKYDNNIYYFNTFAFNSSIDNDKYLYLNKNILFEMKDIYDARNGTYGKNNWNKEVIKNILSTNKFHIVGGNADANYATLAECIMNLFSNPNTYNDINNLLNTKDLSQIYDQIQFKFDKDNKLINYNLYKPDYTFPNNFDDVKALQYAKDNYSDIKSDLKIAKETKQKKDDDEWFDYEFTYNNENNAKVTRKLAYSYGIATYNYVNTEDDFIRFFKGYEMGAPLEYNTFVSATKDGDYWIANYKTLDGSSLSQKYLYDDVEANFDQA